MAQGERVKLLIIRPMGLIGGLNVNKPCQKLLDGFPVGSVALYTEYSQELRSDGQLIVVATVHKSGKWSIVFNKGA